MPSLSNYAQSGLYNHFFRSATFAKPSTIAIALTTNIPTESDTGATIAELPNANGYTRVMNASGDAYWRHVIPGSGDNAIEIAFPTATGDQGMVSGVVILDSNTHGAGNSLMFGALPTPRDIKSGDVFRFVIGNFDIFFD
jgi:hypothetical protein